VKEVHLKPAALKVQATGENGSFKIVIASPVLARSVSLAFGDLDVKLSDNYFDLLPGESVTITATGAVSLDALRAQLRVISLTDAFPAIGQPAAIASGK
jgi:beta-mannosidase